MKRGVEAALFYILLVAFSGCAGDYTILRSTHKAATVLM